MRDLEELLRRISLALEAQGLEAALVGGLAVSVRTEPRFTRDVDLAVAVSSDEQAEGLVTTLVEGGWRMVESLEQEAVGRLTAVRLVPPGGSEGGRVADLLFASSGIEREVVAAAEELEVLPGVRALVARTGHLIVLKLLARAESRPQDETDLVALVRHADAEEFEIARRGAAIVVERGFHRGRDLPADLEALLGKAF